MFFCDKSKKKRVYLEGDVRPGQRVRERFSGTGPTKLNLTKLLVFGGILLPVFLILFPFLYFWLNATG